MKTMTMMQSAGPGTGVVETQRQSVQLLTHKAVFIAGSRQSSVDSDVNAYCVDKLRSLTEDELRTL